jgi:NhaP-type Na+/H+ or K+/H+ antiporter
VDVQLTLESDTLLLVGAVMALSAVFASAVITGRSRRFRIPGALLFLVLGMVFGDDGLNLISLDDAELVQNIGVVALPFILLEGGMTTKPTDLRLAALPGLLLATFGVALTAGITGVGVWLLLDVDVVTAGLIGAVVGSTGPGSRSSSSSVAAWRGLPSAPARCGCCAGGRSPSRGSIPSPWPPSGPWPTGWPPPSGPPASWPSTSPA